jgi:hypothetical protein
MTPDPNQPSLLFVAPTIQEYNAVHPALIDLIKAGKIGLAMSGMGPEAATSFCKALEAHDRPLAGLVLLGWAGGLSPNLQAGDVVIASSALDTGGSVQPCCPIPISGAIAGPLLTVPTPARSPKEKKALHNSGAIAVEMEAYPLASWARAKGLPFIHTRVVLDTASESLPDLGNSLDIFGNIIPFQLTMRLISTPRLLGQMYTLYRKIRNLAPILGLLSKRIAWSWFEQKSTPD